MIVIDLIVLLIDQSHTRRIFCSLPTIINSVYRVVMMSLQRHPRPCLHKYKSLRYIVLLSILYIIIEDAPNTMALTSSGYSEICKLSESETKLQYVDGKFVEFDEDNGNNRKPSNETSTIHKKGHMKKRYLTNRSSFDNQRRNLKKSEDSSSSSTIYNNDIFLGRECICGTISRNKTTFCIVHHNENHNHCQIPTSKNDPVECFHSSVLQVFIRNLWPLSWLWMMALTFYVFSTETGRSTIKYVCSQVCCCFRDHFGNTSLIEIIISRETSMRNLYQIASLTRAQEELANRNASVVTYILKTREYFSGRRSSSSSSSNAKPLNMEKNIEMTKTCSVTDDVDICESPSNETLLTSPDSFGSSPTFDDASPINSETNNDEESNAHQQQDLFSQYDAQDTSTDFGEEEEEEPLCSICMMEIEDGDRVGVLSCNHLFHADCLKGWIKRRNVCPLCQVQIAEEKSNPNETPQAPTVRYPTTFTVRTTGSPIEPIIRRRPRVRRSRAVSRSSGITDDDLSRRQLFVVNENGRIPPMVSSSAGVTLISTRRRQNQRRSILVGDAAGATLSSTQRERNIHLQRRPMQRDN